MRHNYLLTGAIRFFQSNQYKLFSNTPTERRVLLINSSISKKRFDKSSVICICYHLLIKVLLKNFYKAIIYCIFHIIRSGFFLDIFPQEIDT